MKPYFSIIVPTLNEEKFVGKLLTDLSNQSFADFEVIVVDAHSKDATLREINKYKKRIRRLKSIQIEKKNVAVQRNRGAQNANGVFLVFLDADTRILSSFLKKLYTHIQKKTGLLFLPGLSCLERDVQMSMFMDFGNAFVGLSNAIGRPFSSGGSMIIERRLFSHIGGFPENVSISEDHLLVQNAYRFGIQPRFIPSIKIYVSLRRFNREGKLAVIFKYIKSTLYFFAKGKVDKKIIEYEMGGHLYNKRSKKIFNDLIQIKPQTLLSSFNKNIRSLISDLDL